MGSWPSTLPKPSYGFGEEFYKPQIKTEFEANYGQSRPSVTRSRRRWTLVWKMLSEANYQILRAFFDANQGGAFTWTHPASGASYSCRFSSDSIKSQLIYVGWRSDVQCPIEEV